MQLGVIIGLTDNPAAEFEKSEHGRSAPAS
jgi:hypothetical protein